MPGCQRLRRIGTFADREELESALAVHGLQELMRDLTCRPRATGHSRRHRRSRGALCAVCDAPSGAVPLDVRAAMRRSERRAGARGRCAARLSQGSDGTGLSRNPSPMPSPRRGWSLAHGLAFLHLDGKLPNTDPEDIDRRVRSAFAAVFPPVARAETTRRRTNRAKPDHDKPNRSASNRSTSNHTESSIQ
jgi:hypothetical protein